MPNELAVIDFKEFGDVTNGASDIRVFWYTRLLSAIGMGSIWLAVIAVFFIFGSLIALVVEAISRHSLSKELQWLIGSSIACVSFIVIGGLLTHFFMDEGIDTCEKCNKHKQRKDIHYCNSCLREAFVEANSLFQETMTKIEKMKNLGLDNQMRSAVKVFEESLPKPVKEYLEVQKIQAIQKNLEKIGLKLKRFNPSGFRKHPLDTDCLSVNLPLDALNALENLMTKEVNNG